MSRNYLLWNLAKLSSVKLESSTRLLCIHREAEKCTTAYNAPQATPLALIKRWRLSWTLCRVDFTRLLSPSPRLSRYESFHFSAFFHLWLVLYCISTIPLCLHNTRRVFPSDSFSLAPCTPVKRRSFACFARWMDPRETTCSDFGSRLLLRFVSFTVKRDSERRLLFVTVVVPLGFYQCKLAFRFAIIWKSQGFRKDWIM